MVRYAKEISDARWETNDLSRRQPVTKLKGDIVPSHSGSRGKTVISQGGHGYENNFVSRDTVEKEVVST